MNRRIASLVLGVVCLLLAGLLMARSYSDVLASRIKKDVDQWGSGVAMPTAEDFDQAFDTLDTALLLDGNNPDLMELGGALEELKALRAVGAGRESHYRNALSWYRQSLAQRPNWPYARAKVVRVHLLLNQLGPELADDMTAFMRVGAWERDAQRIVIPFLFDAQDRVPDSVRRDFFTLLHRAAAYDAMDTLGWVRDEKQLATLMNEWKSHSSLDEAYVGMGLAAWMMVGSEHRAAVSERLLKMYKQKHDDAVRLAQHNRRLVVLCMMVPRDESYPKACSGGS